MIKIAQIIDKETSGVQYLETYQGEIINNTLTVGIHILSVEVMEFDGETPVSFIEAREVSLDLDNLNGKTIREALTEIL